MDERIPRAAAGDADALGQLLYERHEPLLSLISGKLSHDMRSLIDPEDVLQQAYVDVFRDIGRFEPKSDRAFFRWLETIVEHRLVDTVRTQKAKKRGGDHKHVSRPAALASTIAELFDVISGEMPTPSRNMARAEGIQALQVQLAALPEEHRDAVRLYHLEGLDLAEVARQTGRTPDAIRGILYRARKKLRDGMKKSSLWLSKK